ncbi:hypothetical protein RchiOBHm_Chr7g0188671 [Rosa chinensis]|uniref:Uncharacterized protein n=1 Tax=Rosa chinensis TaxID=74649 RepID=A0A2P6P4J3_ROSCH|nr:hypothetical protein RchiOBHm_Chr7g0188671 [Rosa chinensis]
MSEISNKWRYFRLDGEPPTPHDPNWFTIAFHHGGGFIGWEVVIGFTREERWLMWTKWRLIRFHGLV